MKYLRLIHLILSSQALACELGTFCVNGVLVQFVYKGDTLTWEEIKKGEIVRVDGKPVKCEE